MANSKLKIMLCAFLISIGGMSTQANAVTIDFESLEQTNNLVNLAGGTFTEDGFDITGGALSSFGTLESRFTGSTALFSNVTNSNSVLTKSGGGAFSIQSIDIAELNGVGAVNVSFFGTTSSNAIVTQTFTLDGIAFGVETFLFDGQFTDLVQLSWAQNAPFHQYDNIVVDAATSVVPVPAALPLFGTGLAVMGFIGWRRKRKLA